MNNCPNCNHDLVNIIYGMPSQKAIDLAREENIALGGCSWAEDLPTHYCYGCHEAYPTIEDKGDYEEVPASLFSE
jgi:hypothetical protein